MRKMFLVLPMIFVTLLSMLLMPALHATGPISASGNWSWIAPSAFFRVTQVADGNVFISAVEEDVFTGALQGTGYGYFTLQVHPQGFATGQGRTTFTGTVLGRSGTLQVQWVGNTHNDLGWWWFQWTILSGTGELASLTGTGSAFGPGPAGLDVLGGADYSGALLFGPG